jgi:hypothetical protein
MKYLNDPHGFWIKEGRSTWLLLMAIAGFICGLAFVMTLPR